MAEEAGGVFQQIGYILSVEDLASPAVARAEAAVEGSATDITEFLAMFADSAEAVATTTGQAVETIGTQFSILDREAEATFGAFATLGQGLEDFATRVAPQASAEVMTLTTGAAEATKAAETWRDVLGSGLSLALDKVRAGVGSFNVGLQHTKTWLESLGPAGKGVSAMFAGLGNSMGAGGLLGFVMGPIGPLLTLLQPLINIVTRTLAPAFEILGTAVENAFAPFAFIAETVAQSFAPVLQRFLQPLVALLTQAAIQAGAFLQGLGGGGGGGVIEKLVAAFTVLAPAVETVVGSIGRLVSAVLPVLGKALEAIIPLGAKLVEMVLGQLALRLDLVTGLVQRVGPAFVQVAEKLLTAFMPLVGAVVKLGGVLLERVFAPMVIRGLEGIVFLLEKLAPYLERVIGWLTPLLTSVADQLDEFFGNFDKYAEQLYVLFIQPIEEAVADIAQAFKFEGIFEGVTATFSAIGSFVQEWYASLSEFIGEAVGSLLRKVGLENAGEKVQGIFEGLAAGIRAPIETMKAVINEYVVGAVNAVLQWKVPLVGSSLGAAIGVKEIPKLAEGGIATRETMATIGEAGPEAILPLRADVIRDTLAPALAPALEVPSIQECVAELQAIHDTIREGVERVLVALTPRAKDADLDAPRAAADDEPGGLGLVGLVG